MIQITPVESEVHGELRSLLGQHRWRLALTYCLFNLENLVRLAQPAILGWAINDLLKSSYVGLAAFVTGHVAHAMLGTVRRIYDTRTFTGIYSQRAEMVVLDQRERDVGVSRVVARSTLAHQFVDFLEIHVPLMIRSLYSIAGGLIMLAWLDPMLALYCLMMFVPAFALYVLYGRRVFQLSGQLHDEMEREVDVVKRAEPRDVQEHYRKIACWRVRLSDWEAVTTAIMELFILALLAGVLIRYCSLPDVRAGDIFAVFRYVLMFVMALDALPMLVQQFSKLKDIGQRLG